MLPVIINNTILITIVRDCVITRLNKVDTETNMPSLELSELINKILNGFYMIHSLANTWM